MNRELKKNWTKYVVEWGKATLVSLYFEEGAGRFYWIRDFELEAVDV